MNFEGITRTACHTACQAADRLAAAKLWWQPRKRRAHTNDLASQVRVLEVNTLLDTRQLVSDRPLAHSPLHVAKGLTYPTKALPCSYLACHLSNAHTPQAVLLGKQLWHKNMACACLRCNSITLTGSRASCVIINSYLWTTGSRCGIAAASESTNLSLPVSPKPKCMYRRLRLQAA